MKEQTGSTPNRNARVSQTYIRNTGLLVPTPCRLPDETPFAATPDSEDTYDVVEQMAGAGGISALMEDQRLFIASSGRLGHAPPNIRSGDQICISSDAQVVHILRPRSAEHTCELCRPSLLKWDDAWGKVAKLDIEEQDVTLVGSWRYGLVLI